MEPDDWGPTAGSIASIIGAAAKQQASVGLEHHDLVRREFSRGIDLDEVAVGVEDLVAHADLVGLSDDVEHDGEFDADEHGVLQGNEHREPERDDQHHLLDGACFPHSVVRSAGLIVLTR